MNSFVTLSIKQHTNQFFVETILLTGKFYIIFSAHSPVKVTFFTIHLLSWSDLTINYGTLHVDNGSIAHSAVLSASNTSVLRYLRWRERAEACILLWLHDFRKDLVYLSTKMERICCWVDEIVGKSKTTPDILHSRSTSSLV